MSFAARIRLASLLTLALIGCSGEPGGPSGGSLSVMVLGLPSGSAAAVTVTGPNGYNQSLTASQSLTSLTPGMYTVAASDVVVGSTTYTASPSSQTLTVVASVTPSTAQVTYGTPTGNLAVTINGIGNRSAAVTVTGPGGFSQSLTGSKTLTGLTPGSYTVTAQNVNAACGSSSSYTVSPPNQTVPVTANQTANASVTYTAPSGGTVNLCIDGMYVIQSAQAYAGTIPLVQNRTGLLRVFVVADRVNTAAPIVQVRLYNGPTLLTTQNISPSGTSVPTSPDESKLENSWNYTIPGSMVQSGLRIEAEVDPLNLIPEAREDDNLYAPPAALPMRVMPALNITFVPLIQPGGLTGNVSDANKNLFLDYVRRMHPIDGVNALVRTTPITLTAPLQDDGTGWQEALDQIDAIAVADGTRYYYGVAKVSYTSGVAGVAYVSTLTQAARAAMGWDYTSNGNTASIVAAHELGHNWGRKHAPCGGPSGIDPDYPEPDGSTGGWGWDFSTDSLRPPTSSDIMGYCDSKWISTYTYSAVMDYITANPLVMGSSSTSGAIQSCLLVWGSIRNGELKLRPAFQITTRPVLPTRAGSYTIEARADNGAVLFSYSFAPRQIADLPGSPQSFVFAVPLDEARAAQVASLRLRGKGEETVLSAAPAPAGGSSLAAAARRVVGGPVAVQWDQQSYPMALVRDAGTGEILSLAAGGKVELPSGTTALEMVLSNGVRSVVRRVAVAQ